MSGHFSRYFICIDTYSNTVMRYRIFHMYGAGCPVGYYGSVRGRQGCHPKFNLTTWRKVQLGNGPHADMIGWIIRTSWTRPHTCTPMSERTPPDSWLGNGAGVLIPSTARGSLPASRQFGNWYQGLIGSSDLAWKSLPTSSSWNGWDIRPSGGGILATVLS